MGKHLLRREVGDGDFQGLADDLADRWFGVPVSESTGGVAREAWLLPPHTTGPVATADPARGQITVATPDGEVLRVLEPVDIERLFHPLRLVLSSRRALMVPIQPGWANRMMRYPQSATGQMGLFEDISPDRLLLRPDNAYYCFPRGEAQLELGAPIIFYVSAPVSACVAEARVLDYAIDTPEHLLARYGDLGVYDLANIRTHVQTAGIRRGHALGLHFGLYVPFLEQVPLETMRRIRGTPNAQPQGLTSIDVRYYLTLRDEGGLDW